MNVSDYEDECRESNVHDCSVVDEEVNGHKLLEGKDEEADSQATSDFKIRAVIDVVFPSRLDRGPL